MDQICAGTVQSVVYSWIYTRKRPIGNYPGRTLSIKLKDAGTRKGPGGAEFVEGHRQNFNYVKIHILEFGGSVAFLLRQILTNHILSIASAMTLNINTNQISSIDRVTAGFIITN